MTAAKRPTSEAVLKRAAQEVELRGLWQGEYRGPNGEVCITESIHLAITELCDRKGKPGATALTYEAKRRMREYLGVGTGTGGLPTWNDSPGRTQAEVVTALRGAAGLDFEPIVPAGRVAS